MKPLILALACATALGFALPAAAAVVPPSEQGFLTGTTSAQRPELDGVVLADLLTPYSITIADLGRSASGVLQSRVVRSNATGTLDFYWRIIPDADSQLDLFGFSVDPWTGVAVDTDFQTDGLGDYGPDRFVNNAGIQSAFDATWYFHPPSANADTYFFFARTDATAYALNTTFYLGVDGQAPTGGSIFAGYAEGLTFAPTVAGVPEPGAWVLMIAGFGLVGAGLRRRRTIGLAA